MLQNAQNVIRVCRHAVVKTICKCSSTAPQTHASTVRCFKGPCVGQTWEDNFQPHLQELDFLFSHRCHGVENCYQQNGMLLGLVYLLKWDHVRRGKTKSHCVSNQPSAICPQLCSALPGPQIGGVNMLIYRNRGIEEFDYGQLLSRWNMANFDLSNQCCVWETCALQWLHGLWSSRKIIGSCCNAWAKTALNVCLYSGVRYSYCRVSW